MQKWCSCSPIIVIVLAALWNWLGLGETLLGLINYLSNDMYINQAVPMIQSWQKSLFLIFHTIVKSLTAWYGIAYIHIVEYHSCSGESVYSVYTSFLAMLICSFNSHNSHCKVNEPESTISRQDPEWMLIVVIHPSLYKWSQTKKWTK